VFRRGKCIIIDRGARRAGYIGSFHQINGDRPLISLFIYIISICGSLCSYKYAYAYIYIIPTPLAFSYING